MHRPIAICAAATFLFAVVSGGAAQAQRGGQQQIVVPAPAVTITPPPATVNVTTPPPTVNVTTPPPVVNVTVPGASDTGQAAALGLTSGHWSFLGALVGLLGVALVAWFALRSLGRRMESQAAETREMLHEQSTLNREAELRRVESERRAIAAAFLAEVGHILRLFKAAQDSPPDTAGFVVMPRPKTPIFAAYAGRLHLLNYETVYAVMQAYSAIGDLDGLRVKDPADETRDLLRIHKQVQVGGTITLVDRANALLKSAANVESSPDRPAADRPAPDRPAPDRPLGTAGAAAAASPGHP